jgi:glucuronate isomerase
MKPFLDEDFLLVTEPAKRLFHDWAKNQPILDYHSHLPPVEIANNARFGNLAQVWLQGDHYKWRLMRANGIPEAEITGHPADEATFHAWARTVPRALGNPLYHWTHLELQRYFGIHEILSEDTASNIWQSANEQLKDPSFSAQNLLKRMKVQAVCTTDDPADDLAFHKQHRGQPVMAPTFRPDKALACNDPSWPDYLNRLGQMSDLEISSFAHLVEALSRRHKAFHEAGGRLSDHALLVPPVTRASSAPVEQTFQRAFRKEPITTTDLDAFQAALLLEIGRLDRQRGWTMQWHIGAHRNLNTKRFESLGPDSGYDAISDEPIGAAVSALLNTFTRNDALPKVILYGLNPASQDVLTTIMGSFQLGNEQGQLQLGSAWWFNDHIDGMDRQLRALANNGLLSRFIGMLTDSRSFLSFPRHEYFRRVLCRRVGQWMEDGLIPGDYLLVGGMVADICYRNAQNFLGLPGTL